MSTVVKLTRVPNEGLPQVVGNLAASKGWSREELARQAGLSVKTISRILSGKTADPKRPTIQRLATALGVDEGALIPRSTFAAQPSQLDRIERMLTELLAVVAPTRPEGADDRTATGTPAPGGELGRRLGENGSNGRNQQRPDSPEEHDGRRRTAA